MIWDWKGKRFKIGPYTQSGRVSILRLWRWDLLRAGRLVRIVRHLEEEEEEEEE